ncbi:MAG: NAD(P)-dependent oxidoreductase [Bacteroidia bacterium]|nr:NAD(P)-dependent oxidoreductase [Bacteroidia bacterium]
MAEYKSPTNEAEFEQNFAQLKPLMSKTEAYYESSRCLFCYDAPCMNACPTSIDIPLFIRQINTGNVDGAAKTIYDSNYFGYACGKVCPTEVLCEGACVYNHSEVKPIEIGRLQSFATGKVIAENKLLYKLAPENGKRVAVIGAGPAGLACACELRLLGYAVDVFEAKSKPSGLTVYGVAPYKITNQEALVEMDYLEKQFGYTVKYDSEVTAGHLQGLAATYDAVFLGIGLGNTRSIGIPGENKAGCTGATEFIEDLRMEHAAITVPPRVVVIGGGNTAMDAASESARLGAESVILAYRRPKEEMGAYEFEYDLAKGVGVKGLFNAQPVEILGDDRVEGVRFIRTALKDGQVVNVEGSEFVVLCDMVILATGQEKQSGWLSQIPGLTLDKGGRIQVNEIFQTSHPQYFAGGDAVNGGAEVVNGAADGKAAARGIDAFLSN